MPPFVVGRRLVYSGISRKALFTKQVVPPAMKNRRSLERMPLYLDVTVSDIANNRYRYSIQNFSLGGLLLKGNESNNDSATVRFTKGDIVNIHFDLSFDARQEQFTQCVKVIWTEAENMGVAFYSHSLALLETYFHNVSKQIEETNKSKGDVGAPRQKEELNKISAQCKSITSSMLRDIYRKYANRVRDNLFSAAKRARDMQSEGELLDVIALLNKTGDQRKERFVGAIEGLFENCNAKRELLKKFVFSGRAELSLVENSEYEHFIIVREMIKRLNTKFYSLLNPLESRFNHLYGAEHQHYDSNPVSPDIICHLFSKELQDIGLSQESNSILYLSFEETLFDQMSELYTALNKVLAGNDILPDLEMRSAEDKLMDSFMNFFRSSRALSGQSGKEMLTAADLGAPTERHESTQREGLAAIPDAIVQRMVELYSSGAVELEKEGALVALWENESLDSSVDELALRLKLGYLAGTVEGIVGSVGRNAEIDAERRSLLLRLKLPLRIHLIAGAQRSSEHEAAAISEVLKLALLLVGGRYGVDELKEAVAGVSNGKVDVRGFVKALLVQLER